MYFRTRYYFTKAKNLHCWDLRLFAETCQNFILKGSLMYMYPHICMYLHVYMYCCLHVLIDVMTIQSIRLEHLTHTYIVLDQIMAWGIKHLLTTRLICFMLLLAILQLPCILLVDSGG